MGKAITFVALFELGDYEAKRSFFDFSSSGRFAQDDNFLS
jgi:hypothetical protein